MSDMGVVTRRQIDPLSDAAARQAALRGATLLVLVSIVMAGAPLERGGLAAMASPTPHREARLVSGGEPSQAPAAADRGDEDGGAAAAAAGAGAEVAGRGAAGISTSVELAGPVRAPVRVALLDLPPPAVG
jgi:hypothetical protein